MQQLIQEGKVAPRHASQISNSRIGLGFEKLDRDVFDPQKAYDRVAQLGVKWIRLQSGWAKTEKQIGVYDFSWLDSIVDSLLSRGLVPWLCLCYGNPLYDDLAKTVFGAVGCPPIYTKQQKDAWAAYVKATCCHFAGRITYYEVWNEPDGQWCWKHGVDAAEYGQLVLDTAKTIRAADSGAKVIGGSVCTRDLQYVDDALRAGMHCADALTFHEYTSHEENVFERVEALRALCKTYNPKMEIIQGESGSQSRSGGHGALRTGAWTERKQAKQLLRHTLADLISGVKFTSYFSCMDMIEALNGIVGEKESYLDYGYFGVLGASFDEEGKATGEYRPKPSYWALQTVCALFADDVENRALPILFQPKESPGLFGRDCRRTELICGGFCRGNGAAAFAYWKPTDLMTTEFEGSVSLQTAVLPGPVRLIDLLDGTIYRLPPDLITVEKTGGVILSHIPVCDYPLLLTFGDFILN